MRVIFLLAVLIVHTNHTTKNDPRSGRWVNQTKTECGIHYKKRLIMDNHLSKLENNSIYIFRQAYRSIKNIAMLWSLKDSNVMVWLAFKAFWKDTFSF